MAPNNLNGANHTTGSGGSHNKLQAAIAKDGFVIIPSILTSEELSILRNACSSTITLARSGQWPHVRTLPTQFPPWPQSPPPSTGIWGVQHLLHPDLPASPIFAKSYFHPRVLGAARDIIGCKDEELVMELYNLLVRPDEDFKLRWHRDDIPWDASDGEEMDRLPDPAFHAQWNLALYDDESLIAVPGSHVRAKTKEERSRDTMDDMPRQVKVKLKAGDAVFYNNNIIHRGVYEKGTERMTLHGSVGDVRGGDLRARNVLQHAVGEWVEQCDFGAMEDKERERAEAMRSRLVELGRGREDVGYSQKN
ncbi:MAG: hypothetical protein M1820_000010 [Bogoriella megaspora]|nr:MAG: hypothetical protein M1820_000010 [Bogoriella megaspora]